MGIFSQSHEMWLSIFALRAFSRALLTVIHTHIHKLMAVAAMQGVDQHRSSLGFSILPKDTSSCEQGNQTSDLL